MSEREIKVGSKWRNVHGEVTVDRSTDWEVAAGDMHYNHSLFRATHEWVSDPAPAVKVGDWVEYDGTPCLVVPDCASADTDEYLFPSIWLGHVSEYEAIPPPPLIAALEKLAAYPVHMQMDWKLVASVMSEYRAIKAKMGVES